MSEVKPSKEELMKSIDAIIDEALGAETSTEVQKSEAPKEHNSANGGDDQLKSGTPLTEEQKAEAAKKSKEKEDEEKKDEDKKEDEPEMKKSEETSEVVEKAFEKKEDESQPEEKEEKKKDEKKSDDKKMKKSVEDLAQHLDADELELIKAWRAEQEAEKQPEQVDTQEIVKSISQSFSAELGEIKKSISQKDDLIKSLTEQVNKLQSQPAYEKKSIDSLETIEKSQASPEAQTLRKSHVLETMFDLQKSGKGITSTHITEFEVTGTLSNPHVRDLVMSESKKRYSK